jgi:hypothetical protein
MVGLKQGRVHRPQPRRGGGDRALVIVTSLRTVHVTRADLDLAAVELSLRGVGNRWHRSGSLP